MEMSFPRTILSSTLVGRDVFSDPEWFPKERWPKTSYDKKWLLSSFYISNLKNQR